MLGFNLSVGRNRQSFGDADAQAFIAATGLTGTTETTAVRRLVANLKTYGLWSKMKAIYPFVSDTVNLLNFSEDFTDGNWNKSAVTITGNVTTAPNGTNTADLIVPNTTSTNHIVFQAPSTFTTGISYTFSYYAKSESYTKTAIRIGGGGYATVPRAEINLTNGSIIYQQGFNTLSVVSSGSGWYRIIGTVTAGSGLTPNIQPLSDSYSVVAENYVYSGNGTSGIYIWGAQLEQSASATTYQPIATTPANRFVSQFKYNLKDPRDLDAAFRLAFSGTWTYSQQGAKPNGVNAFADTKLNPTTVGFTQTDTHISAYLRTDSNGSKVDIGGSYNLFMGVRWTNNYNYPINRSNNANATSADSIGYFLASRVDNVRDRMFKNGTNVTNFNTAAISLDNTSIVISATNGGGLYSDRQTSFNTIGNGLTDTEASNLYTSVQTFNQDLSRQVGVPIVSDSDAQSFLNAAVITDTTQANAINTLVIGLKNASLWTKMKAIYPFVGGTATTHKWNLKDPRDLDAAYRLAFSGAWTHSSTGALPNGTNAFADTFLTPSSNLTANSTHASYYSRTNVTTNAGTEIGTWASGYNYGIELNLYRSVASQKTAAIINSGGGTAQINGGSVTPTTGLLIGSRTANNNGFVSKNGTTIGTNTTTVTTQLASFKVYLGAANNFGTAGAYSNKESAFASIGDGITEAEATTLNTLVTNFETTLNRNV